MKPEYGMPEMNVGETRELIGVFGFNEEDSEYIYLIGNSYVNGGYPLYVLPFDLN
jgi:hypothetical protein